ncbi:MAG: hypothetical protein ABMA64_17175 [Myxococcota bacterium]
MSNQAERPSSMVEVAFLVFVLAPVTGGMLAGPVVGGGLLTLTVLDSILILLGFGH